MTDVAKQEDTTQPQFELSLPARPENVAVVRHAFGGLADAFDIADQALADIKLAVTEACTNVVVHAYPDEEGPIVVSAAVDEDEHKLTVVVADEGRGITPRADSPGLGLGLPLIATLSDSLELGSAENGRTEVRMTFSLNGHAGA